MTRHNDLKPANDDDVFEVGAPLRTGRLDEILGFHLRMANVAIYQDYTAAMGDIGLTQKQFAVLELIAANPKVSQIDIANQLSMDRATMMALVNRLRPDTGLEDDITPRRIFPAPQIHQPPPQGHVMVMIEYRIDPARAADFRELMLGEGRRSRLRHGALSWELLHDIHEPSRFVEVIVDESWTDHLRRFDRVTAADVALRDRKLAFHLGEEPPRVTRSLMETTTGSS